MKRIACYLLALIIASTALGQTAVSKIADGRAALVAHNMPLAHTRFAEALALDPTNQTAAALLGLTRLFDLTAQASTQTFLDGVGVTPDAGATGNGRDVYNWNASPGVDGNDEPVLPTNYNFTTFETYWQGTLIPESTAARANFATVTNPNFLITLSPAETKMPVSLNVDYADILMARACLRAAEFLAHWGSGQNLDANLDGVLQAMKGDLFTVQKLLGDNPNFLAVGSPTERAAAKTALQDLITLYRQASVAIRARPAGLHRLFMLAPEDLPMEAEFRQVLDKVEISLSEPVDINGKGLFTKPLFEATWSARAELPTFSSTGFNVLSVPDASLGGIISGFTKESLAAALSDPHDTVAEMGWEWVSPKPMGNTLYKYLALPGGKHLVTGNGGTHLTSTDGTNWTYGRIPGLGQFVDVATDGAGKLVGVSPDGYIYASTDAGVSWHRVFHGDNGFNAIAYTSNGGGKYVAVGDFGLVVTSADGESWDENFPTTVSLTRIFNTGSLLVAGCVDETTGNSVILTSADGVAWTQRYNNLISGVFINSLTQGAGTLIALLSNGTQQLTSVDGGVSWTLGAGPGTSLGNSITYSLGKFVAVGGATTQVETATAAGSVTTSGTAAVTITGAGITGSPLTVNVSVASGDSNTAWANKVRGALAGNTAITALYTVGGSGATITLTQTNAAANDATLNIALANGTSIGITAAPTSANTRSGSLANIATSPDGVTWTPVVSGEASALTGAAAGVGATYAVGQGGVILTSLDNITFTRALNLQTATNLPLFRPYLAVKAMDGQLYVGGGINTSGGAMIARSSDGQSFTPMTVPATANNITDFLRIDATHYYAVGNGGTLLTSTNGGANWSSVTSGTTSVLNAIAFLNGKYIAVGNGSTIITSADGATWAFAGTGLAGGMQINGVAYGNGVYVAVGGNNNPGSPASFVITSSTANNSSWTQQNPQTNQTFKGIVFSQGVFTAVGTNGVIRRSTDGVNWEDAGSGDFSSNLTSVNVLDGRYYATQANVDLSNSITDSQCAVLMSSNGTDWVRVPVGTANIPNRVELFGGRLYTANGNATILRSASLASLAAPVVTVLTPSAAYTSTMQGHTLTLTVTSVSEGAVTYQWKKDGIAIPGETGATLVLHNIQPGDAGSYTVDVTNAAGTTTSSAMPVTVSGAAVAPVITSQPESQTVNVGLNAIFSVEATGTTPFTYLWKKDGVGLTDTGNISGSATDTLTITGLTAANAGSYTVEVTNTVTTTTSDPAVLTVDSNPAYDYTTFSGLPGFVATTDGTGGPGGTARYDNPHGMAIDASGNLYVVSPQSHTVRKITSTGAVSLLGGLAYTSGSTEAPAGPATTARFNGPRGVALNAAGTELYIADTNNGKIRKIVLASGIVSTFVSLSSPVAVAVDASGNVYTAGFDHTVRKYSSAGTLLFTAGSGNTAGSVNGTTTAARFNSPQGIALDAAGANLYVADSNNALIRKVATSNFAVTTLAGRVGFFGAEDGAALSATFQFPMGVAVDSLGNVLVTDNAADTIRKVSPAGIVSTVGGEAYNRSFNNAADGDARFSGPAGIAVDAAGALYIAENFNQVIRKGTPVTALNAPIIGLSPQSQTVNVGANVSFSVVASGISTLTYQWKKNGTNLTDTGNVTGSATATLSLTNVQTADMGSYSVLVTSTEGTALSAPATLAVSVAPVVTVPPGVVNATSGGSATLSVTATDSGDVTYQWRRNGIDIAGATGSSYTIPTVTRADADRYDVVINGVGGSVTVPATLTVAPASYPGVVTADPAYNPEPLSISTRVHASLALPGGKWLAGGDFVRWGGQTATSLVRLNADLSLDTGYTPPTINGIVYSLALAPDGSVYIGGDFTAVDGHVRLGVARLTPALALDLSWKAQDNSASPVQASALAVQADGKLLVARMSFTTGLINNTNVLHRLNTDGTLDGTFSTNIVLSGTARIYNMVAEPGGSIVISGLFTSVNGTTVNGIARVNSTGATLDANFVPGGANNAVFTLTRQADGSYLVGGQFTNIGGQARNRLALIAPGGAVDGTFVPASSGTTNGNVLGIAKLSDGRILAGGTFTQFTSVSTFGLVRLSAAGAVDRTYTIAAAPVAAFTSTSAGNSLMLHTLAGDAVAAFGTFQSVLNERRIGVAVLDAASNASTNLVAATPNATVYRPAFASAAFLEPDNKVTMFGSVDVAGGASGLGQLVRLNTDGTRDGTFPAGGSGFTLNGLSTFGIARAIRQSDGKYVAMGDFVAYNGVTANKLVRINADGSHDSSFDAGGGPSSFTPLLYPLSGGRLMIHAFTTGFTYNGSGANGLIRINADGSRDFSFDTGAGFGSSTSSAVLEQPGTGKVYVAGSFTTYNGVSVPGFIRLNADGSRDTTFNPGTGATGGTITGLTLLRDNRVAITGSFTAYNGNAAASRVAIITADGVLDGSFTAPAAIDGPVGQVLEQEDGKLIVSGDYVNGSVAVRVSSTGVVDSSFGLRGITCVPGANGTAFRMFLDDAGRLNTFNIPVSVDNARARVMLRFNGTPAAPSVVTPPASVAGTLGGTATLSVSVAGTAPFSYQWRRNTVNVGGATDSVLHFPSLSAGDAGSYDVVVTNSVSNVTSAAATVSLSGLPQVITFNSLPDVAYTSTPITLSASSDSGLTVTFAVTAGPATVTGSSLTLTGAGFVTVRASQAGNGTYAAATPVDRTFEVTASGLSAWLLANFTAPERANPLISGPNAVYGQDGLPNLVKYALGLDPKQNITSGLPAVSIVGSDWVYTYSRPDTITDVTYAVEISTDLVTWTAAGVTHEFVSNSGGKDTYRGKYPLASAANINFRLKVTQP